MAQLIHRSLLLAATIQLSLVSVTWTQTQKGSTVTVKLPPHWPVEYCCREGKNACQGLHRVTVNNSALTFNNLKSRHGTYRCYCASDCQTQSSRHLYLKVDIACSLDYCKVSLHLSPCGEDHSGQSGAPIASSEYQTLTRSSDQVVIRITCSASECPFRSNCSLIGLHFYHEAKSWIDALEHCHNNNSSLVHITNQTVQTAVKSLLQSKTDDMQDGVWIGLERSIFGIFDIPWMWTSGLEVKDPQQWNSSFPVDRFNNHCGKIIWVEESKEFEWLDANCHEELPFMCQVVNEWKAE